MNVALLILIEALKKDGIFLATDPVAYHFEPQALPLKLSAPRLCRRSLNFQEIFHGGRKEGSMAELS
ncbi:MAG: hypothetical protein KGJ19_06360 [Betaproteobacteria bacterium]|nr:hypothetical protein [Betaproteobacteria bacterium]